MINKPTAMAILLLLLAWLSYTAFSLYGPPAVVMVLGALFIGGFFAAVFGDREEMDNEIE